MLNICEVVSMKKYVLRPILMFTGTYKNDSVLDREGVFNSLMLIKQNCKRGK